MPADRLTSGHEAGQSRSVRIRPVRVILGTVARSFVEPHRVRCSEVRDPGIEVPVAVEVAEGNRVAVVVSEILSGVGERTGSVIDPTFVGLVCVVRNHGIEVADGDRIAEVISECLFGFDELKRRLLSVGDGRTGTSNHEGGK